MTNNRTILLTLPSWLFVLTSVAVALGIFYGWFGDERDGIMAFCEHAGDGYIKQPANSVSNLAFSLAGIFIAWHTYRSRHHFPNRMTSAIHYPLLMSGSLIILGAGSFAMHATNTALGGFLDLLGMFMVACFMSTYAMARWYGWSDVVFIAVFVLMVSIGSYIKLNAEHYQLLSLSASSFYFAVHLLLAAIFELMLHYIRKTEIKVWLGWTGIFILLLAFAIWNLSRTQESLLCDPHLWLQGHAVWHVLNAVGACFVFLFYRSEKDLSAQ